ncbi:SDR family NAD(P)-dependent oxidoreductase [Kitasatospora sp. NPDC052896]|uniref:SDR family NAD(P)-dependent oxidoreductase n=1 Tax=Kitasatospora sp. NPDC052896 TaxID=3364061 RepID=UPI0037CBB9CC
MTPTPSTPRTVLVTGSTAGIGEAIARAFARGGHTVVVNGRDRRRVGDAVARIESAATGKVLPVAADVATAQGVREIVDAVPEVDVLVNNAGIFGEAPAFEITDEEWQRYFDVNVLSGIRLTRAYAPGMAARGWGRVIFISSESAISTPGEMIHYGMTKTAQLAVARGFAQAVAGTGVTVNSVLPGPTRTPGVEDFLRNSYGDLPFEEAERRFIAEYRPTSLIRRLSRPDEVASLVCYLGTDASSSTTGAALRVDGGVTPTVIP